MKLSAFIRDTSFCNGQRLTQRLITSKNPWEKWNSTCLPINEIWHLNTPKLKGNYRRGCGKNLQARRWRWMLWDAVLWTKHSCALRDCHHIWLQVYDLPVKINPVDIPAQMGVRSGSWGPTVKWGAVGLDVCWGRENQSSLGVAMDRVPIFQWMTMCASLFDSVFYFRRKKKGGLKFRGKHAGILGGS